MKKITPSKLQKFADKAGISIAATESSPYPTLEQLAAFAAAVQGACADKCLKVAQKHQQLDGNRASAMKAGALECHQVLNA
jgi:hypothetical protein